jgi:flagellar motor switch protein FliN/FliY
MMDFEQRKKQFETGFNHLLPVVTEALNQLLSQELKIEMTTIRELEIEEHLKGGDFPRVQVQFVTSGKERIHHRITFPNEFGLRLFAWMVQADVEESLTDEHLEGLTEGSNQIFGQLQAALEGEEGAFTVDDLQIVVLASAEEAGGKLPGGDAASVTYAITAGEDSFTVDHFVWWLREQPGETTVEDVAADLEMPDIESEGSEGGGTGESIPEMPLDDAAAEDLVGVQPADFESFDASASGNGHSRNIDMLLDVNLKVLVELGRKTMLIRDILKLGKGSVVELDKAAGEPLEIFVNGRKLAEGEVVVVDDHFGVRITQLAGPKERIKSLR